jgi:hypothetical protein
MNKASFYITAMLLAGGMVAIGSDGPSTADEAPDLHTALELLADGRLAEAEAMAAALASEPGGNARAWAIVGSARERDGRPDAAADAYQEFLPSCSDSASRRFALGRLRQSLHAAQSPAAVSPPSERLTDEQRRDLAHVGAAVVAESSEHFVVRARNAQLARLVALEAEASLARICGSLLGGQEFPHSVDIYIWPTRQEFLRHAQDAAEWAGGSFSVRMEEGLAVRRIDLTQRDGDGRFWGEMLDRVLPHELCHLVLREYFGDAPNPLALNEGLAMIAEQGTHHDRVMQAGMLAARDGAMSLDELLELDRHEVGDPSLFYAQSFSFVQFLHSRLSPGQVRQLLDDVRGGCTVADALTRALCIPPREEFMAQLDAAWAEHAQESAQFLQALERLALDDGER